MVSEHEWSLPLNGSNLSRRQTLKNRLAQSDRFLVTETLRKEAQKI